MLFHAGSLFDGHEMLPREMALLVQDGLIAAIEPLERFDGYAGPRRDISGMTLMPGLMDCHVHLVLSGAPDVWGPLTQGTPAGLALQALANAQACLRGGVTAIRDCGGVDHVEFAVRDACNSGTFMAPVIQAAGQFICMTGGANAPVARIADGPEEIRKAVREQVHAGCDWVKLMATGAVLTPGSNIHDSHYDRKELSAGVAEAARFRKPTAAHAIGSDGILNSALAGVSSIEHGIFLTDYCIQQMLSRDIFLVPTLAAVSHILDNAQRGIPGEILEKAASVIDVHRRSVKAYHDAGGPIAMGADTGTPFNPHGQNAREMAFMVDAGLPPISALRAATSAAARLLQLTTRGWLREGFVADLLLVSGDPTHSIDAAASRTNHIAVYKAGLDVDLGRPSPAPAPALARGGG
jgi:imidazolonepropionase-like amidohydrolase